MPGNEARGQTVNHEGAYERIRPDKVSFSEWILEYDMPLTV